MLSEIGSDDRDSCREIRQPEDGAKSGDTDARARSEPKLTVRTAEAESKRYSVGRPLRL